MTTTSEQREAIKRLHTLSDQMVEHVQPLVDAINREALPITKDNYGEYLRIFTAGSEPANATYIYALARACKIAGGNIDGIEAAMHIALGSGRPIQ